MKNLVGVVMGSKSDWPVMKNASEILDFFEISHESLIISAHRTPDFLFDYASEAFTNGIEVIIAGAGGAAHLPGMLASKTSLPIIGVPIESKLQGLDSLLSISQMPSGVPVGTMAIGKAGAINGALFAASILANKYPKIKEKLDLYRQNQTKSALEDEI